MKRPRVRPITRKTRPVLWTLGIVPWLLFGWFVPQEWSFIHMVAVAVIIGLVVGAVLLALAVWDDRRKGLTPPS
jgi:hypothetical protein